MKRQVVFWAFGAAAVLVAIFVIAKTKLPWIEPISPTAVLRKIIQPGVTFVDVAREAGIATGTANQLLKSAKVKYDLARIVSGRELAFVFDNLTGEVQGMVYNIDSDNRLMVNKTETDWDAELEKIPYEIKEKEASGTIETSLFAAMNSQGLDDRLTLALAETFAWQIDFAADIREGDSFKVIYEDRYLDGKYVMPGKILAAEFVNDGAAFRGFYFGGTAATKAGLPAVVLTKAGYYDESGNSLQKIFLKSPLQYKYISSGFSYGRLNPITKKIAPHRGIDYAANYGTPAVSIGDGTVVQAGWNGPYGISVLVRHNETYGSRYGHFQSLARGIRVGAKVKQGQVVGYVGATGEATGPHLHFEIHKFGALVDPFKVAVPPGEPVADADRAEFEKIVKLFSFAEYPGHKPVE